MLNLWRRDATWISQSFTSRNSTENWVEKTGVTQFSPWTLAPGRSVGGFGFGRRTHFSRKSRRQFGESKSVLLTNQAGVTRFAMTNSFGYFRFNEVKPGETYIVAVISKRYSFAPQVLSVIEEMNDLNFSDNQLRK